MKQSISDAVQEQSDISRSEGLHESDYSVDTLKRHGVVESYATAVANPGTLWGFQAQQSHFCALFNKLSFEGRIISNAEGDVNA